MTGEPSLTRRDLARKAGVDLDDVDRFVDLGLLHPGADDGFSDADVLRARWIRSLERSGLALEDMAAAVRDGGLSFEFLGSPAFDRFSAHSETTFRELSERTGVPFELRAVDRFGNAVLSLPVAPLARGERRSVTLECAAPAATLRGRILHEWLAGIEWLDERTPLPGEEELLRVARRLDPSAPEGWLRELAADLHRLVPSEPLRSIFERPPRGPRADPRGGDDVEVWRERPFLAAQDGALVRGVFDRVVVWSRRGVPARWRGAAIPPCASRWPAPIPRPAGRRRRRCSASAGSGCAWSAAGRRGRPHARCCRG